MTVTRVLAGLALLAAAVSAFLIRAQERRLSTWQPAPAFPSVLPANEDGGGVDEMGA
jgi:hypothetical protein